jgi:hypothetical protein
MAVVFVFAFLFLTMSLSNSVSIATRQQAGQPGFDLQQGQGVFLIITMSRPALGSAQPPIYWVPCAFSLGVKQAGHEADHLPPSG